MRRHSEARQDGFTLLELLVSLALLGITVTLLFIGAGGARRVSERVDVRLQDLDTIEGAETVLRHRIESAVPSTHYLESHAYADFEGTPTSVDFVAPPSDAMGRGAPRRYSLLVAPDGSLVLSSVNDLGGTVREYDILLRNVQSLDVSYFGIGSPNGRGGWVRAWSRQMVPPQLVRIRVYFPPGDRRWWPDLVVHPMADLDTDCNLELPDGVCQGR